MARPETALQHAASPAASQNGTISPWWSEPAEVVVREIQSRTTGLTAREAADRLTTVGPNLLRESKDEPWWEELLEELREPMILLLIAVGVLYALFGERRDAITIIVVIAITIAAEVVTEWRANRAVAALAAMRAPTAPVLRDGAVAAIPVEMLVPGDVVALSAGERAPADLRLISSSALAADESALTGESTPSEKRADAPVAREAALSERATMVHAGSVVTRGEGLGLVVAIGAQTELARIAQLVAEIQPSQTPLQRELARLSRVLVWIALGASALVPVLLIGFGSASVRNALLTGLTLAFATIPEELPILITAVLALGSFRLAKRHAIVKTLQAAEALGSVSMLVSDKTGTLTENRMIAAGVVDASGARRALNPVDPFSARAARIGLLANDAVSAGRGDPTDRAFFAAAERVGIDPDAVRRMVERVASFPFADETRTVAGRFRLADKRWVAVKGAPEAVLARCVRAATATREAPLDEPARARLLALADHWAAQGFRVLATADRRDDLPADASRDAVETDLTFVAFVLLEDPIRAGAAEAAADLAAAGVRLIMITGDHPATAGAIGRAVGLGESTPVTGADLPSSDDGALARFAGSHPIVARATPQDKYRLVEALERSGERVAVTGDGVNDAPALARATVGVAMGKSGTDVAREAADLVLADDNFATIVVAVREARHLYDNLRKAIRFYLAVKVALILATVLPAVLGQPLPFAPVQIILLELLMDLGASVSFVAEPAEGDVMRRPPRDPRARFLDRPLATMVGLGGVSLAAAVLGVYGWAMWVADLTQTQAQTAAFTAWLVGHVILAMTFRSEREPLRRLGFFSNRVALVWMTAAVGVALLAAFAPPLQGALRTAALPARAWLLIVLAPLATTLWIEVLKEVRAKRANGGDAG